MSKILDDIWAELEAKSGSEGDGICLFQLARKGEISVFAAFSTSSKARGFMVQMPHALKPRNLARQGSTKLEFIEDFSGLGQGKSAIGLFLKDLNFLDLFNILVDEVVGETVKALTTEMACTAVVRCILRWRMFLEKKALPLGELEIRGLIGELLVLSTLSKKLGSEDALRYWRGPLCGIRDFELPDYSVEVKTCVPADGSTVAISRTEQLDSEDIRPVYLVVVTLAKSESAGNTLNDYVNLASEAFRELPSSIEYADRLAMAGYLSGHAALYEVRYGVSDVGVYEVRDGFPRIESAQIPAGVSDVRFKISVSAIAPFKVNPVEIIGDKGFGDN